VSVICRDVDGGPLSDLTVRLGGYGAEPGLTGVTVFPRIFPGLAVAKALVEELSITWASVIIRPELFHGLQLVVPVPEPWTTEIAGGGGVLTGGGVTVDFPDGTLKLDGQLYTGTLDIGGVVLVDGNEHAMPGDSTGLFYDEIVEPIELFGVVRLSTLDGEVFELDGQATLSLPIDAALGAGSSDELRMFFWDGQQGYWKGAANASWADGVATGPVTHLGWWGVGSANPVGRGCLTGKVVDPAGVALAGADVSIREEGRFGRVRVSTDETGNFCAGAFPDIGLTADVYGLRGDQLFNQYIGRFDLPPAFGDGGCDDMSVCGDAGTLTLTKVVVR
jgi:hypothetical protein